MEVTAGVEVCAQGFNGENELGEVVIIGHHPCSYCGSIYCDGYCQPACGFCGGLGCGGSCQICPCECGTPYCTGLHCYSDCPEGSEPCSNCGECGCNGECMNTCADGSERCWNCGECGCNGACMEPPGPDFIYWDLNNDGKPETMGFKFEPPTTPDTGLPPLVDPCDLPGADPCICNGDCPPPPEPKPEPKPEPEPEPEKVPCPTSVDDLKMVFPNTSDANLAQLANLLNANSAKFGIDSKAKLQHFLAQAGHENGGFGSLTRSENLNYSSADRLMTVWPSRFSQTDPNRRDPDNYVNNSEGLANYIYANRMGNGNENSGDGYEYRGRGLFQLTGRSNYEAFQNFYNNEESNTIDIISNPNLLTSNSTLSITSALWFYKTNVLDKIDVNENTTVLEVTKRINGGKNGLTHRTSLFNSAKNNIDCNN